MKAEEAELLDKIKEQHAKELGYSSFRALQRESYTHEISHDWRVISQSYAKQYAKEAVNNALQEAAEKAKVKKRTFHPYEVDKESILSLQIKE